MRISTKGRYAIRLMLDIAINSNNTPVSIKDISRRQQISDKYLEQIISILNSAGFVRSIRGAQGGYVLRKMPYEYTVGMILRLTESFLSNVSENEDIDSRYESIDNYATVEIWRRLDDAISGVIDHITLEDLIEWQNNNKGNYTI